MVGGGPLRSSDGGSTLSDTLLAAAATSANPALVPLDTLLTPAASPEDDSLEPWIQTIWTM